MIDDEAVLRVPWPLWFLMHYLGHGHFEALQARDDTSRDSVGSRSTDRSRMTAFHERAKTLFDGLSRRLCRPGIVSFRENKGNVWNGGSYKQYMRL